MLIQKVDKKILMLIIKKLKKFLKREIEVLKFLMIGKTNSQIAES